jgi:hypothetical protein
VRHRSLLVAGPAEPVGWVERSETHHPSQHDNAAEAMGFTSFYPSYALSAIGVAEAAIGFAAASLLLALFFIPVEIADNTKRS